MRSGSVVVHSARAKEEWGHDFEMGCKGERGRNENGLIGVKKLKGKSGLLETPMIAQF